MKRGERITGFGKRVGEKIMKWNVELFGVHTAYLGIFTAAIQRDSGGEWKLEINGLVFKARWKTLDEAKAAAPALCKKHFQRALDAVEADEQEKRS